MKQNADMALKPQASYSPNSKLNKKSIEVTRSANQSRNQSALKRSQSVKAGAMTPVQTSFDAIRERNQKLTDLSEKILRLDGGETLGKYFRTKLEPNGKGGLIARVQPIIATYGTPEFK